MNKRILISLSVIAAVAAIAIGGTVAYFSDTETSTGNTFTAGSIDLDNGLSVKVFDLFEMKPGDMDQGSYVITATSNNYWACMKSTIDKTPENGRLEMEKAAGDTTGGANKGELQNYLYFYVWNDRDGNGEYNGNGENLPNPNTYPNVDRNLVGPYTLVLMNDVHSPLADKSAGSFFSPNPLVAGQTYNLGYAYCFGIPSDNSYTTITCSGAGDDQNMAQTDGVKGTTTFYAVQSDNNMTFECSSANY